jgi:ubiquinone/menaquinone biosynthesis C-methylase UbiE
MKKNNRWEQAQNYEKNWWDKRVPEINFEFYKVFAEELISFIEEDFQIAEDTKILEIGSGAGGIITYLKKSKHRYAIDPLEKFYSSQTSFVNQRDKEVIYSEEKGEALSFEDSSFDFVIMDNVLDHCEDPNLVFSEVKRVLKKGGYIYFKQNTYNIWGKFVRSIMELFVIDKGHPFTFRKPNLREIVKGNGFVIMRKSSSGYFNTWKKEVTSAGLKNKAKAFLFVTRDKVTCLLKK